jgi:uncharacterized protein
MNDAGSPLLSVRAEARELVAPDYAVMEGQIEHVAPSKAEAVQSVTSSLERLTADLASLGAVPFDASTDRSPLTWSAHSATTHEERYHDKQTGQLIRPGQVSAQVALGMTLRDLDAREELTDHLMAHPDLTVHTVTWHVDWDNPAWPRVRAAAIAAAISKARDYAAALGAALRTVEHIADTGLLGGDGAGHHGRAVGARSAYTRVEGPGAPALDPVPQELIATIEARFRTTEVSL